MPDEVLTGGSTPSPGDTIRTLLVRELSAANILISGAPITDENGNILTDENGNPIFGG